MRFFGENTLKMIENDDDVICTTKFSKVVPLEGGEVRLFISKISFKKKGVIHEIYEL